MSTAELHIRESAVFATALVSKAKGADDPYAVAARRTGGVVPRSKIYSLVRRAGSLKSIASHYREALAMAYAAECERQKRLLEHEIAIAKAAGASSALVGTAARLGGVVDSEATE